MKLLNKTILNKFEKQGYTGDKKTKDIKVICKFFNPSGAGTWYCYEYDPKDRIFQAFVNLNDPEMAECGAVSLNELESLKCPPFGLGIERDLYLDNHTLEHVINTIKDSRHI